MLVSAVVIACVTVATVSNKNIVPVLVWTDIEANIGTGTSTINQYVSIGKVDIYKLVVDASLGVLNGAFGRIGMKVSDRATSFFLKYSRWSYSNDNLNDIN